MNRQAGQTFFDLMPQLAMLAQFLDRAPDDVTAVSQDISALFYKRKLRDDLCPIVAGRRLIPLDYIDQIRLALRRQGRPMSNGKRGEL